METKTIKIEQAIVEQIINLAKKSGIEKIILFGSRARGDNKERSDIDLAVTGGNIAYFRTEIDDFVDTLLMFDVVNLDGVVQEELRKSIEEEGVVIYEKV